MVCISSITCSECGHDFQGVVNRDTVCPSCLFKANGGEEKVKEYLAVLYRFVSVCTLCGLHGKNTVFYNGMGFCDFDHLHEWYKEKTGSDAFPRVPFVTVEDKHLFLIGAKVEPITIDDIVNDGPYL